MNTKTSTQTSSRELRVAAINRVADRIDLAIDLLTLGQYGLECREVAHAGLNGCEGSKRWARSGSRDAWEAPRKSRRPDCSPAADEWAWPRRTAPAVVSPRPRG